MKLAYDIKLKRPACVLVAAGMGACTKAAGRFPVETWLLHPTPDMAVYETSEVQLEYLVRKAREDVKEN